jgi:mono/diheme cytochrome c family protein
LFLSIVEIKADAQEEVTVQLQKIVLSTFAAFALMQPAAQTLAADTNPGKANYDKLCASCHGADGKGNPAMAKVLGEKGLDLTSQEATQKSDEQLLKIIVEGAGKMPASKLTKEESKQVLGYVRSLGK